MNKLVRLATQALFTLLILLGVTIAAEAANITVCDSGCDYTPAQLQTAINSAVGGDEVLLQEGRIFTGCFTLPKHTGDSYAVIRTGVSATGDILATNPGNFPTSTQQMTPARAATANLAKIQCNLGGSSAPALRAKWSTTANVGLSPASAYWHIKWLDLSNVHTARDGPIVEVGYTSTGTFPDLVNQPHHFIIEQNYIHGDEYRGGFRGVKGAAADVTIKLNWISDIWARNGWEGQALLVESPSSDWTIEDNYISCGTECALFGGSGGGAQRTVTVESAGRTTTSAVFADTVGLFVGRTITVAVGGLPKIVEVTSCGTSTPGAACDSNTVNFTPALQAVPDSPGAAKWGQLIENITMRRNTLHRPMWQYYTNPIIAVQTGLDVVKSETGGTLSGEVCYKITGRRNVSKSTATSPATEQTCVTFTGSTGSATVSWDAGTVIDTYYIYRGPSGAINQRFSVAGSQTSFLDTGATGVAESPPSSGSIVNVKNLLEIKNGTNFLIEGNLLENNWDQAQDGVAVLFTVAPSSTGNPTSELRDIVFQHNIIRTATGGFQLYGRSQNCDFPSARTRDITIHNNLWYDLGAHYGTSMFWGFFNAGQATASDCTIPYGPLPQPTGNELGALNVTITNNTVDMSTGRGVLYWNTYTTSTGYSGFENVNVSNNSFRRAGAGMTGNFNCAEGNDCWTKHTKGTQTWQNNFTESITPADYPGGATENLTANVATWLGYFSNPSIGNYRLTGATPLDDAGSDGNDIGADLDAIDAAFGGAAAPPAAADPPNIPDQTLATATVGSAYSQTIVVEDGTLPNTCAAISGLPAQGISLNSAACSLSASAVTGSAGDITIQIQATDADDRDSNTKSLVITVVEAPAALAITTTTLTDAVAWQNYCVTLEAENGTEVYAWTATDTEELPTGVTLNAAGELCGVPTTAGTYEFTAQVIDSAGASDTQALTLVVDPQVASDCPTRAPNSRFNNVAIEGAFFVSPTPPTGCIRVGDRWENTSFSPPISYKAITASPTATWVVANPGGVPHNLLSPDVHPDTELPADNAAIAPYSLLYRTPDNKWAVLDPPDTATQNTFLQSQTSGLLWSDIGTALTNISATSITSGVLDTARIPDLDASKITSGTIDAARLPASADWQPITYLFHNHDLNFTPGSSGSFTEFITSNRRRAMLDTQGFNTVQMYVIQNSAEPNVTAKLQYCSSLSFPTCNTWTDTGLSMTLSASGSVWARSSETALPVGAKAAGTWFRVVMADSGTAGTGTYYALHLVFRP